MPITPNDLGLLLRRKRERARLSQPEAARRAGVSTRLWSETERGERPHVSFATMVRVLAVVGVALQPTDVVQADTVAVASSARARKPVRARELAALRADLRQAEAYGVDLSLLRASLEQTPLQRLEENDDLLAFFEGITVVPGRGRTR